MHRRAFLAAAGAAVLGGCLGSQSSAAPNAASAAGASVESSPAPASSTVLEYGDWHSTATAAVTVTGTETIARLRGEASTPDGLLPAETKLVVVSGTVENTTESELALSDVSVSFGVVASEKLFEAVGASEELLGAVEESSTGTHLAGTASVAPTERHSVWQAVLVPESLSTADVQVAARGDDAAVRWEPSSKSCDCPG